MQAEYIQNAPIYLQILQNIRQKIASGEWPPGTRIPPVRELSLEYGVNPNTAQRSLAELEREGLLYTERTTGRYITDNAERIHQMKSQMAIDYASLYYRQMRAIGYSAEEMAVYLQRSASFEEGARVQPQPQ